MLVSLVVCTVERTVELERLLDSLRRQTFRNFEVVLVDQNEDDRLTSIISEFEAVLAIRHLRSPRGLSRARNAGLAHCSGAIIGFPDDDCWYPPDLLRRVVHIFETRDHVDFVTVRWQDENGNDGFGNWPSRGQTITVGHVWKRAISFAIFMRSATIQSVGPFDERLGVGAGTPWGSSEETDYLLRAMKAGAEGWHEPTCIVHHPRVPPVLDERVLARARSYSRGAGFVLRKHRSGGARIAGSLLRPLVGAMLAIATLNWKKAKYHFFVLEGRCVGLRGYHERT